jgi:hypothetical protein
MRILRDGMAFTIFFGMMTNPVVRDQGSARNGNAATIAALRKKVSRSSTTPGTVGTPELPDGLPLARTLSDTPGFGDG